MAQEALIAAFTAGGAALGAAAKGCFDWRTKRDEVNNSGATQALTVIGEMLQRELQRVHDQQAQEALRGMQRDERLDRCHEEHAKCQVETAVLRYRIEQLETEKAQAAKVLLVPEGGM